ncbi:MAG: phosphopantetheine-binding protein [Planctomycetota bacterium]
MSLSKEQITTALTSYLLEHVLAPNCIGEIAPDDDLLEDGLIDSLGVMHLLAYIQSEFGFEVPPENVTVENFISIDALASFLHSNLQEQE